MKIGFVVEPYEENHSSGMGYSVMETMLHLPLVGPEHQYFFYSTRPIARKLLPLGSTNVLMPRGFVRQFFWFMRLRTTDVDALFFVAPLLPLFISKKIRTIVLCKDLASFVVGAGSVREYIRMAIRDRVLMSLCVARATFIAASSYATKRDLMDIYAVPEHKIAVTYEGFQNFSDTTEERVDETLVPYFFFTGKVKYRKNVHGIAAGFVEFKKRTNAECRLVIAGDSDGVYHEDILRILRDGGVGKDARFVGYVSKGQLKGWYVRALGVVFPSFNEGFGMPVIEAMSLGTPVITSNLSSLPEVAGDAAILVDPYSNVEIGNAMEKIFTDPALRNRLIEKGYTQAKKFSWTKTVQAYLILLKKTVL